MQAREESFIVLQDCINKEFPSVEQEISTEVANRELADAANQKELIESLQQLDR